MPAVSAALPGFEAHDWYAVFTPAGTAPSLVAELGAALRAVLAEPDIRQQMTQPGATVGGGGPEELAARMEAETRKWGEVIREAGIQAG